MLCDLLDVIVKMAVHVGSIELIRAAKVLRSKGSPQNRRVLRFQETKRDPAEEPGERRE